MTTKMKQRLFLYPLFITLIVVFAWSQIQAAFFNNGFDLTNSLIDREAIHHGGPPKDGIPAIDHPKFLKAAEVEFLNPDDRILGLNLNGVAKAYPIKILNYHEIVNDFTLVNGLRKAIFVSYCPLCGSGVAYSGHINGENTTFGVSGLLYNSDVLLYDRKSESLWSQIMSQAISGPLKGQKLQVLDLSHTSWQDWQSSYPNTLVLSTETGHSRDYNRTPYQGYDKSKALYFPVNNLDKRYHPKEYVIGVEIDGKFKAYPFAELSKAPSPLKDRLAGKNYTIHYDAKHRSAEVKGENNTSITTITSFWFAWMAFHPNSEVYQHNNP